MAETENEKATGKRYYWLKLQDGFFNSKRIKKLRRLAGGDTYTIIYLKMQLLAMKTDGILSWTGLEDDFASELALDLDEEPDNVEVTLRFMLAHGLAETSDNISFLLPYAVENTGSEGSSAKRMRDLRARNNVTQGRHEVTHERNEVTQGRHNVTQASQSDKPVTRVLRLSDGEKESDRESESEKESIPVHWSIERGSGGKQAPAPADCGKPTVSTDFPQSYQQPAPEDFEKLRSAAIEKLNNRRKP